MKAEDITTLAQRKIDQGDNRAIATIEAEIAASVVEVRHTKDAKGATLEHIEVLGDGTERPVVA